MLLLFWLQNHMARQTSTQFQFYRKLGKSTSILTQPLTQLEAIKWSELSPGPYGFLRTFLLGLSGFSCLKVCFHILWSFKVHVEKHLKMEIISHSNKEFQEWWDRILFRHLKNLANSPQLERVSRGRCLAQSVITIFPSWIGLMNSHTCTPHCQSPLLDTSISMSCRSQITKLYSLCLFRAGRETKLIKNPTNPVKLFLLSLGFG